MAEPTSRPPTRPIAELEKPLRHSNLVEEGFEWKVERESYGVKMKLSGIPTRTDRIPTVATLPSGVPGKGNKPVGKHYAGRTTESTAAITCKTPDTYCGRKAIINAKRKGGWQ